MTVGSPNAKYPVDHCPDVAGVRIGEVAWPRPRVPLVLLPQPHSVPSGQSPA